MTARPCSSHPIGRQYRSDRHESINPPSATCSTHRLISGPQVAEIRTTRILTLSTVDQIKSAHHSTEELFMPGPMIRMDHHTVDPEGAPGGHRSSAAVLGTSTGQGRIRLWPDD
jgi:hypothetical protein